MKSYQQSIVPQFPVTKFIKMYVQNFSIECFVIYLLGSLLLSKYLLSKEMLWLCEPCSNAVVARAGFSAVSTASKWEGACKAASDRPARLGWDPSGPPLSSSTSLTSTGFAFSPFFWRQVADSRSERAKAVEGDLLSMLTAPSTSWTGPGASTAYKYSLTAERQASSACALSKLRHSNLLNQGRGSVTVHEVNTAFLPDHSINLELV